jgi:hypothetical protein
MPNEDKWLNLPGAIAYIREYAGLSTGAAQVALRCGCSSEFIRSLEGPEPLIGADWIGTVLDLLRGGLYRSPDHGNRSIPNVSINFADLDWWLRNRWETGTGPSDPVGQAEQNPDSELPGHGASPFMPTGAPGRPTKGMHVIKAKFQQRCRNDTCLPMVSKEAAWLEQWFKEEYPTAQPLSAKTIETGIRDDYRAWKQGPKRDGR